MCIRDSCIVSRTGYSGELGYEVFCHPKNAEEIFKKIWKEGQSFGLTPLGLEALNMLRIEAGLIFAGYEFNDQIDPFEAGIGFTVPLKSKKSDFIGRSALEKRKMNPQKKLVGLDIKGGFDGIVQWVIDLKKEMEIPETLKDMGVQPGDEVKLAPLAQEDPSTGGNPLEMTEEKFQELIANCISGKY